MNVKFWERGFKYEKICTFQKKNYELKMQPFFIFHHATNVKNLQREKIRVNFMDSYPKTLFLKV
jgi:hypothetical protein